MKKFILISLLFLSACSQVEPVVESTRLSIDELEIELENANADAFYVDVSTAYSLFPIAFADSDGDKHGDLVGIIEKLDYLNDNDPNTTTDLGIDAIWLNPIHPTTSYHKYDVIDYYDIDPKLGDLEDFKRLIEEAHSRGIKIILDMVFNHTSSQHPWFLKALMEEEPYFSYYNIEEKVEFSEYPGKTGWNIKNGLTYYSGFWSEMPELDVENEAVRDELKAILSFWMDLGVDGFRYDAAKHVYDTNEYPSGTPLLQLNKQFWMELRDYVKDINPDVFLIGEVWLDSNSAAPYAPGFDSLFNFDVQGKLVQTIKNEYQSNFINYVNDSIQKYENKSDSFVNAIFLSNHDQDRIFSQLSSSENKLRLAANLLFALPGIPFIYYGEELGMTGVKPDEKIREPFVWNRDEALPNSMWEPWVYNTKTPSYEEQVTDPNSIWSMYKDLIALRKAYPVLKDGKLEAIDFQNNRVIGLLRSDDSTKIAQISNLGSEAVDLSLDFNSSILYNNKANRLDDMNLHLEPYGSVYLMIE